MTQLRASLDGQMNSSGVAEGQEDHNSLRDKTCIEGLATAPYTIELRDLPPASLQVRDCWPVVLASFCLGDSRLARSKVWVSTLPPKRVSQDLRNCGYTKQSLYKLAGCLSSHPSLHSSLVCLLRVGGWLGVSPDSPLHQLTLFWAESTNAPDCDEMGLP